MKANLVFVFYSIGVTTPITPDEQLPPLPHIPGGALVVVEGRAPIWRYGMAFHLLHGSPAGAIAVFDPRLGAVVVASHHPNWQEGQVIDIEIPQLSQESTISPDAAKELDNHKRRSRGIC